MLQTQLSSFDVNRVMVGLPVGTVLSSYTVSSTYVLATSQSGWDWLTQIRYSTQNLEGAYASLKTKINITAESRCDETSCQGCPTILVQRLCLAYQKCALVRCVGTLVNQVRPLCAVGLSISYFGANALQTTHGAWVILAEMMTMILQATLSPGTSLDIAWPEDVFMGHICTAKDLHVEFWYLLHILSICKERN
jgi:hypothetical protein